MARKVPEINSSSQADIAFMLLIFFLVTTTMDVDSGISRVLPPFVDQPAENEKTDVKERNILEVLINSSDRLLVENKGMRLEDLKETVKEFYINPLNDKDLPDKYDREVDYFGVVSISKGVISLQSDRGTTYGMYIKVQNQIAQAVNELRDQLSMQKFGRKFDDIADDQQKAVKTIFPNTVSEAEPKKTK